MTKLFALSLATFAWSAAAAGSALAAVPAWCKDAKLEQDYDLKDLSDTDTDDVVVAFAKATCAPNAEAAANRAEIERARAAWSKKLYMSEADWADAVAYARVGGRVKNLSLATKDFAAFSPLDQYHAIREGFSNNGSSFDDYLYLADSLDHKLTEVGRLGVIEECINGHLNGPVMYALCQGDIDKLDRAKFAAQLRTDTSHDPEQRMQARVNLYNLGAKLKEHAGNVAALWKKDEAYKRMFDAAAKGRAEWAATLGTDTAMLDLAQKLDSATLNSSRKQFEGCAETTQAALAAAISKVPAKTFANMRDVRKDPFNGFAKGAGPALVKIPAVSLAAIPWALCRPESGAGYFLVAALQDTPGYRGPRMAALSKLTQEPITLDDMNERVSYPEFDSRPYRRSGGGLMSAGGVIKSTKAGDKRVIVALEKLLIKRNECVQSHRTNRLSRINRDGSLEYETICDKMGTVTYDETWSDFEMNTAYAPLLKKGVLFSSVNGPDGAEVIATWANKGAELPNTILGVAIK